MPNRIPTPGISSPAVRKSPGATAPAKAKSSIGTAESMLNQKIKSGKVTDIGKTKQQIANKTGVWPNGKTN